MYITLAEKWLYPVVMANEVTILVHNVLLMTTLCFYHYRHH